MTRQAVCILLALVLSQGISAAELGRLFLTPPERDALDRVRHARPIPVAPEPDAPAAPLVDAEMESLPPAIAVTIDGYITRSGGEPTVWINGAEATAGALADVGIAAGRLRLERAAVRVPLERERSAVLLKPGQSFDPGSKQVSDAYEHAPAP